MYKNNEILKLLQFTEMIIFHSLIILMSSKNVKDKLDLKLYQKEYE